LSEKRERARGYLEGYETGLKEAWEESMGLCTGGYQPREIRILAKSKMVNIQSKLDALREEMEATLGESLEDQLPEEREVIRSQVVKGGTYLVEGEIGRAFELMRSLLEGGYKGLCVTRTEPNRTAETLGEETEVIWLTNTEVPDTSRGTMSEVKFRTLSPTSTDMLTTIMIEFLREEGDKVALLGGIDFLMTYNDFPKLLRLIQNMKDRTAFSESIMLVSYDPELLEERNLKRLHSEIQDMA
jgi:hypothetical protein